MIGSLDIVERGRIGLFRAQAIIDRNDIETGLGTKPCASWVMALQIADNKSAAVEVENCRGWAIGSCR